MRKVNENIGIGCQKTPKPKYRYRVTCEE